MKLKITMRQSAPDAEVVASTTQSNKRKCQEIEEPNENPSRPAKPRRIAKLHKTNAEPSALEKLPSEIQYLIYTSLFQFTKDKGQFPRSESPPSTVVTGPSKGSSSNVTSILRVSKKTNLEAAQAFHDTFTRPVSTTEPPLGVQS
jgi:hypothetical protein